MKVFTVGLDQKPPIKDASDSATPDKTNGGSPPPGYVPTQNVKHIPLPMGPEIPQPPHPIIMRKSRGYKGILMVMLSVFLMALFALTLSEIAYNRQRDENFFRLRWAELKHRLGYGDSAYDYYHRANAAHSADRYFSLNKNKEMAEALIQQSSESSSTTTPSISSTSEPVVAIDSFPPKPSSFEQQQQGEGMIRDARLQFLKTILQKIKQHAEDMGFDGTMQVSVIEVEPQTDEQLSPFGGQHLGQQHQIPKGQSFHPLLPNFFPHLPIEDNSNNQQQAPKSDSFMDGFGEYHQPTFMQNNQVVEQNRANRVGGSFGGGWPREEDNNNQQQQQQPQQSHNGEFGDVIGMQWPRANINPFRPESFFHPMNNWQMLPQQQQQQFPQPSHILPRPPSFDRWSGGGPQQAEGEDNSHGSQQQQQPHQPMIQAFPQQPAMPMLPPMVGPNAQNQQQQPEQFEQQSGKSNEHFSPDSSSNASPSQEVVGEIYGRKFGRMLQDIIANRIQGFQNMQQLNPLMLPPSAVLGGPQQPEQRSRLPFAESMSPHNIGTNQGPPPPMGPPFFPPPPPPPPSKWPCPSSGGNSNNQAAAHPNNNKFPLQHGGREPRQNCGKIGFATPSSSHFLPDGSGPGCKRSATTISSFCQGGDGRGTTAEKRFWSAATTAVSSIQELHCPRGPNPGGAASTELPSQPEVPMGGSQPRGPASSNSDEPMVKTLVDNNMNGGPRGWTHQYPKSSQQQEAPQPQQQADSDSNSQESVTPPQTTEDLAPASQDSKSSSGSSEQQQQASGNNKDSDDVWLVAPPHRTQPPPAAHMVDASTDDSSAPTPSSSIHPPAFSPPKEPASMTTHRLSTASFIEPDQAVSFTSFAHISKQLPIKLSFTKNHQKPLPPPTLPPRLNLSSQNLVYHPLIAIEDNYSELIETNNHLEPLPSQVYRTDSEASIISGSSDHLHEVEEKGQGLTKIGQIPTKTAENPTNFGKETIQKDSNTPSFGSEKEKSVENKFNLVSQVKNPDFLADTEKKEVDDYDLPDTSLATAANRLSILPLNDSQSSGLNLSSVPEDQLTLRVEPQLIAATEKFEDPFGDQNLGFGEDSKNPSNSSTILSTGEELSNFGGEKSKEGSEIDKKDQKIEKNGSKPIEILSDQPERPAFLVVTPAGMEPQSVLQSQTTTSSFVVKQETTTSGNGELEEMRKRVENNILVSGNTQLDELNMAAYPEEKTVNLKTASLVDPSGMDKEDGSELEEEDHHVFGDHGLHTVDFPAVKFPTMGETGKPAGGSNPSTSGDAPLSTPQNDQQGQQAVHSNPVFFQVDDPSSIEQTAPRTVAA